MNIFLARNNVQAGPYTLPQLNQMLGDGQVVLTDLMWHEGMENWRPVGEMTHGSTLYQPVFEDEEEDYIINNTPEKLQAEAAAKQAKKDASQSVWDRYNANNPHLAGDKDKEKDKKFSLLKSPVRELDVSGAKKQLDLAPIGSRIVAKLIDFGLMLLASMPMFIALYNSPNFDKLLKWAEAGQTTLSTAQQMELVSGIPQHILLLTNILVWGLIFAQMLLLLKRGQTLGKMVMGIRILDRQSNGIPNFLNLIVLRSLLPMIVYSLSLLGLLALVADFVVMLTNADRQSLHDKIARTYVVIADDTQTTPLELKPEA